MVGDKVADGVIAAASMLVGSAAAWFVVDDAVTEHASFAKERVGVVDNIDANDGVVGGDGDGLGRPSVIGMAACNFRWSHSLTVAATPHSAP